MCGIAGIVAKDGKTRPPRSALERMLAATSHRGPDDEGIHEEAGVCLGHRRLSIQDLTAAGHQPMPHHSGLVLTYNGEVYNHREIRAALDHAFRSSGDTETLLEALAQWGVDGLSKVNGMFAFGLWNAKDRSLTLVRDRMGVKPLYYAQTADYLLFCSELKGILASGLVDYAPDAQAVSDYLALRFVPPPLTAAKGIFKLAPGELLFFKRGEISIRKWWELPVASMGHPTPSDHQERFEELLHDAVDSRLIADVPVGIFLSGGLDSSAVAAEVAGKTNGMKSFSVAFEGGGFYDERFYARLVADKLKTDHSEIVIGQKEFEDSLPEVLRQLDEPIMDLAALPLYYLAKHAREQVKVVLSGEGADETLGGYNFNRISAKLKMLQAFHTIPRGLRDFVRSRTSGKARSLLTELSWPSDRYPALKGMYITKIFDETERHALLDLPAESILPARRHLDAAYSRYAHADPINQMLAVYSESWLSEDLLMKADKMTMAHALELRVPFLDYRLVEYLFSLPGEAKVTGPRTTGTKRMLRRAMQGKLPRPVLTRDKRGFPVPLAEWTKSKPGWFEEVLGSRSGVGAMFDRKALTDLTRRSRNGAHVWQKVWNLSSLWLWDEHMRQYQRDTQQELRKAA